MGGQRQYTRRRFVRSVGCTAVATAGCAERYAGNARSSASSSDSKTTIDFDDRDTLRKFGGHATVTNKMSLVETNAYRGKSLRVEIPADAHYGVSMSYYFSNDRAAQPTELWTRWHVRFPTDFVADEIGGKLPGPAGRYGAAGWGGRKSNGENGWSARMMFRKADDDSLRLAYYVYHADMTNQFGDLFDWDGTLDRGVWYRIDQHVRMNTPGEYDGVLRGWVDGERVFEKTDLRFRDVTDLKIQEFWFNVYWGGDAPSPADNSILFDTLRLAPVTS